MNSKLTEHFTWSKVIFSETAIRAGVDNTTAFIVAKMIK